MATVGNGTRLTEGQARVFLEPHVGVAATIRADGTPQVTPVWVDTDGENVLFNTAEGRAKPRNLRRDPRVSVFVMDRENPFRWVSVTGTAELSEEGAVEHIDKLAKKYAGRDEYGVPPGEKRLVVKVRPERIDSTGTD